MDQDGGGIERGCRGLVRYAWSNGGRSPDAATSREKRAVARAFEKLRVPQKCFQRRLTRRGWREIWRRKHTYGRRYRFSRDGLCRYHDTIGPSITCRGKTLSSPLEVRCNPTKGDAKESFFYCLLVRWALARAPIVASPPVSTLDV